MINKSREYIREEAVKVLKYIPEESRKLIDTYIEDLAEEMFEKKLHADDRVRTVLGWIGPLAVGVVLVFLASLCVFTVKSCAYTEAEISAEVEARCDAALQDIEKMKKDDARASSQKLEFCRSSR